MAALLLLSHEAAAVVVAREQGMIGMCFGSADDAGVAAGVDGFIAGSSDVRVAVRGDAEESDEVAGEDREDSERGAGTGRSDKVEMVL